MPTFVDTNVIVYTFDTEDPAKHAKAQEIVADLTEAGDLVVSTQILQELYVTLRRRFVVRLGDDEIELGVRQIAVNPVIQVDIAMILAAINRVRTASISFWDALIVEAALAAGATRLLTEDLQDGHVFDGVLRVENPFR
jgi:predicted nucleic acid-binding protein